MAIVKEMTGRNRTAQLAIVKQIDEFLKTEYSGDIDNIYNEITKYKDFMNEENMVVLCHDCHTKVHYSDNHELSPYRWESATTIERVAQ